MNNMMIMNDFEPGYNQQKEEFQSYVYPNLTNSYSMSSIGKQSDRSALFKGKQFRTVDRSNHQRSTSDLNTSEAVE